MEFKKASRKSVKIKLGITGPTGSGKTYSALRLAKGLGGKCAVIDTENGSASLYSDRFDFDVCDLAPPFTTERYLEAIKKAIEAGYETLIIDSLTHAWSGAGGILERKSDYDQHHKGNSYANWKQFSKEHESFIAAMLQTDVNLICTMRSKTEYVLEESGKGKSIPRKMGLSPIQRDGVDYEFSIVFDVQMDHKAETSKDRTGIFTDQIFQVTEQTGETIKEWIEEGGIKEKSQLKSDIADLAEKLPQERKEKLLTLSEAAVDVAALRDLESKARAAVFGQYAN